MLLHNQYEFNPATDLIAKGGFAEVYRAHDHNLNKTVAIKRFVKEAGTAGSVSKEIQKSIDFSHPNIIRYFNYFSKEYKDHLGRDITEEYGVMEFANAGSLSDVMSRKRKITTEQFKELILGILDGLAYLHSRSPAIIHRDLKPSNILLHEENGQLIPKICDFGISKELQGTISQTATAALGTIDYMSPEQIEGKAASPATDLWALGCIIYEYFNGQPPFGKASQGASAQQVYWKVMNGKLDEGGMKKVPEPFRGLVKGCLVVEVDKRVSYVEEAISLLLVRSKPTTPTKSFNWNALYIAMALIVGVSVLLGLFLSWDFENSELQLWDENLLIEESEINNSVHQDKNWVYKYNSIKPLTAQIFAVELDGKWGLVDPHGNEFTLLKYSDISPFNNELAYVNLGKRRIGIIDTLGREIIAPIYEHVNAFSEGIAAVNQGKFKHGFVDRFGKEVTPLKFDEVKPFSEGLAAVKSWGWRFINKAGIEAIVDYSFDEVKSFSEGLAAVRSYEKWGFIDRYGVEVIPCRYEDVQPFMEGRAAAKINGRWGFIDTRGNDVAPFKYASVQSFSEGRAAVLSSGKWGFIEKSGQEIIPLKYSNVNSFKDGFARVKFDSKYGYINKEGKEIVPVIYHQIDEIFTNLIRIGVGFQTKYGFVNRNGIEVIPAKYDHAEVFVEDLALVGLDNFLRTRTKYGFIDTLGREVIPLVLEVALSFSEGLAAAKYHGAWGYFDTSGKVVIPFVFEEAYSFYDGAALVKYKGKWGFIDTKGKIVIPLIFNYSGTYNSKLVYNKQVNQ
jgi:serine/threonine protein kinase